MLFQDNMAWQKTTEVAVIGYGAAGAVAAITAHDEGAEVLIVEKQAAEKRCSNTSMSGGAFIAASDVQGALTYAERLFKAAPGLYWTDEGVIRAWAEGIADNKRWVESTLGCRLHLWGRGAEHRAPGAEAIEAYSPSGWGFGLMKTLEEKVNARRIPVLFQSSARRLITDFHGRVAGVQVESQEGDVLSALRTPILRSESLPKGGQVKTINIRASRAVVLTCGGFEYHEPMKLNYLRVYPTHFYGSPANTGDGIRMAVAVGADLWHMNCCSARMVAKFSDFPIAFTLDVGGRGWLFHQSMGVDKPPAQPSGYIIVDGRGKRFTNEDFKPHTIYYELALFDSRRLEFPRVPSYLILDRKRIEAGALPIMGAGACGPHRLYEWSPNNQVEIDKGWIIQADTVSELARKLSLPPDSLVNSVNTYNGYCDGGEDREFQRNPERLVSLRTPPFYGVRLWPGGPNTQGGPRRNARAQVLNGDGEPIPGLYSAGELGSVYGMLYTGGGNIAECLAFGRIAGRNAARPDTSGRPASPL